MEKGCGIGKGAGEGRCWGRRGSTIRRHRVRGERLSGFFFFSLPPPSFLSVLLQVFVHRLRFRFRRRKTRHRQASVQALVL